MRKTTILHPSAQNRYFTPYHAKSSFYELVLKNFHKKSILKSRHSIQNKFADFCTKNGAQAVIFGA